MNDDKDNLDGGQDNDVDLNSLDSNTDDNGKNDTQEDVSVKYDNGMMSLIPEDDDSNIEIANSLAPVVTDVTGKKFKLKSRKAIIQPVKVILNNYLKCYTDTCFRRTTPMEGILPVSHQRWLRALTLAQFGTKGNPKSGNNRVKATEVEGLYGLIEKSSQGSYTNLCRMTAEPFPLVDSGRAAESVKVLTANNFTPQPLISPQDGFVTAQRYARVMLSPLGKLATRWYKYLPMTDDRPFKSIVPISLLRKSTPWSLGFKTQMRPLNPSELFRLMARMIEAGTPNLSDADVQDIFRGVDLGENYLIFSKDEGLMSLYASGRCSIRVVPDIEINRVDNRVIILRPVLDDISNKLCDYYSKKLIDAEAEGKEVFTTFKPESVTCNGNRTSFRNVDFKNSTDEQIKMELWSDINLQVSTQVTNVITELQPDGSYKLDIKSIPETLWKHILWEYEEYYKYYQNILKELEQELKMDRLLEKVTRPPVAKFVHSIMKDSNRIDVLLKKLGEKTNNKDKREWFPNNEYFEQWEAEEIFRERGTTKVGEDSINILGILFKRDKYQNLWEATFNKMKMYQEYINNPQKIYADIHSELLKYADMPELKRKSTVFFAKDINPNITSEFRAPVLFYNQYWDNLTMPCTIYYDSRIMYKSFGANINAMYEGAYKQLPRCAVNCTTKDILCVFHDNRFDYLSVGRMDMNPIVFNNINGIIPWSDSSRILVNIISYSYNTQGMLYPSSGHYIIVPIGGFTAQDGMHIGDNEVISGFIYLDDPEIKFIDFISDLGYARVKKEDINVDYIRNNYSRWFNIVYDICGVKDENEPCYAMIPGICDSISQTISVCEFNKVMSTVLNGNVGLFMSKNLELYYKNVFHPNWVDFNFVINQKVFHGKKSVLPEFRWIVTNDSLSKKVLKNMLEDKSDNKGNINLIKSSNTKNYDEWNISKLEDWSVIDERFGCPDIKPANPKAIEICESYMFNRFSGVLDKERRPTLEMQKRDIDYTTTDINEFNDKQRYKEHINVDVKDVGDLSSIINKEGSIIKYDDFDDMKNVKFEEGEEEENINVLDYDESDGNSSYEDENADKDSDD